MSLANTVPAEILEALVSKAMGTGHFDQVNQHEPKAAPGNGLSCSIWAGTMGPASSGLATTSVKIDYSIRIYSNMLQEPQDMIDPNILAAAWDLMEAITANHQLGLSYLRMTDLFGEQGDALRAEGGYIDVDKRMFRVFTINVAAIVNDAWTQGA